MKKSVLFLFVLIIALTTTSFLQVSAQEKSKEEKEQDYAIQKAIEEQKKAMMDQKRAQEEALENLQRVQEETDNALKDINVEVEVDDSDGSGTRVARVKRINKSFHFDEPFIVPPGASSYDFHWVDADNESTEWEFSKRIKEKTIKSDYTFDVEKSSSSVVMSVNGDCKEGEIRIRIVMPNGKTYSDVVIDEFGSLNWRKSFSISDTENQDKAGAWKFIVTSNKASGYFKISLQAY